MDMLFRVKCQSAFTFVASIILLNMDTPTTVDNTLESVKGQDLYQKMGLKRIPFTTKLSFAPLIRFWKSKLKSKDYSEAFMAEKIIQEVDKHPELLEPIEDIKLLDQQKNQVDLLLGSLFPSATRMSDLGKVISPFDINPIYVTPMLEELMHQNKVHFVMNECSDIIQCTMVISACSLILNKYYGQSIEVGSPMTYSIQNAWSKLPRFYKTNMNIDYVDIKKIKPLKPLSQQEINRLLSNIYDVDLWLEYIPPENFEFHGLILGKLIDITAEEALSRLKYSLLERDAVVDKTKVKNLESQLRTYFQLPDLKMGITAIDYPLENAVPHKYKIRFDFLAEKQPVLLAPDNRNSIYEKACRFQEVLLVEDLNELSSKTPIERDLLAEGIQSIIVAPLFNKDQEVIGLLEVGAEQPYELNSFVEMKLKDIKDLFSIAVERSREEIDNRIESIIREQFTAVHPSVEWKFIEASYKLLEEREIDFERATIDPIIFSDIYPLYGQADIVSSSTKRNAAIRADLIDNLEQAKTVLTDAIQLIRFPLLNQTLMKVNQALAEITKEFNSNDESRIVEFLSVEVHPLLKEVSTKYDQLNDPISAYLNRLNPDLGIIYNERKAYEESVIIVNNTIAGYLDNKEREMQKILPHYFEKYKTDGVEYDMYVGQSLLNKHTFNMMHLRNFRLAQLIDMCNITRKVNELQDQLPVPLTTAQLIFAYSTPLSIRFRMDEKQFDVDGAYNVRYEILKKRIDKAIIEGTGERLTTAGKVAIVYLQEKDRQEYLEFFEYLQHEGFITDEIEDVRLGKLQGVQGLRALRVEVKL